jgi:hypothetical protein
VERDALGCKSGRHVEDVAVSRALASFPLVPSDERAPTAFAIEGGGGEDSRGAEEEDDGMLRHVVLKTDTLVGVALRYGVSVEKC